MRSKALHRKFGAAGGLLLFLFLQLLSMAPEKAYAQYDAPLIIANDNAIWGVDEAKNTARQSLTGALFTGIVNLLTFAANRLAYDMAVMLASGATDGGPLLEPRQLEDFAQDYKAAVAGEAVYQLSESLDESGVLSGFDLCAPTNPEIMLQLRLGIRSLYDRPDANCDISQVKANWEGFIAETIADVDGGIFRNEVVLTQLSQAFDPSKNEFAVGVAVYTDILGKSEEESKLASSKLIAQGPIKDVTDAITNRVETPSSMINYEYMQTQASMKEVPLQVAYATLSNTDALLQIGISAGSVFANTFLSQMTNKLYTGLFDFDDLEAVDPFDQGMAFSSNRETARERFKSLLAIAPLEVTNYSLLNEFSSCPTKSRGLYNCVADSSFISAIARAEAGIPMTLEEAIEDELVDGNWPLISSADSSRDQDPYCYTYGFCHSNIVKLRKARIIPIGWELAAESQYNEVDDPVTLQEAIDGFDDCSADGERDANHPWCKLIDPNWVLKYPETQCKSLVYGQLLETEATDKRQEECVDMPSCIAEDENGTCTGGYGYCVREENIWRFRGDSCPEYAASCLSFENSQGEDASYLLNSVDYGPCGEDDVGCLWYATEKEEQTDGTYEWPTVSDVAAADAEADAYQSRVYFTAEVEECDEEDGGCTQLIERDEDLRFNELMNASFEEDEDDDGLPDGWTFTDATTTYDTSGVYSRTGSAALNPGTGLGYQSGIVLQQGTFYTLSYYARLDDTSGEEASVIIAIEDESGAETVNLSGLSTSDGCSAYGTETNVLEVAGTNLDESDFIRFTCTFTSPTLADETSSLIAYVDAMAGDVWIDDLQLEQGEDESDYHDGYSDTNLQYTYVKVAPDYLGCDGSSDDPDECENYAAVCLESEVGCTAYAPANGDPTVYGVASAIDECPSTCVDYETYKQEPTLYEPSGDFPVYFIADSAESCSEEEAGCDEFTRLDDESLAYFAYLRACVTPEQADANSNGDEEATFYTWEGSDLTGYQLVTWNLLESDLDTLSTYTHNSSGTLDEAPGAAPCTTWVATDAGITCADDSNGDGDLDTDSESCDQHDDIFDNPNCREFYDADGYIHYRDWQYTVTVNDECASFRKTDLVGLGDDDNGDSVDDGEENCEDSGGYFDSAISSCRYYGYEDESAVCSESANGCREYTGGRSRNSRLVMSETFEGGDLTDWDSASATNVTYSNESVATDGHSIAAVGETFWTYLDDYTSTCDDGDTGTGCSTGTEGTLGGSCTVSDGDRYCGTLVDELYTDKTYTISFWAKGSGNVTVGFDIDKSSTVALGSDDAVFDTVSLSSSNWEEYQLGPIDITDEDYATFGDDTVLAFIPEDSGVTFYIDNIVIREGEDNITLIKDSWVTPDECDEDPNGNPSDQYYLGCQEYTTQDGETAYLKSFSSLCSEDVVGCDAFFQTHESSSEYAQVFGATCASLTGEVDSATECYAEAASSSAYDEDSQYLCTIAAGESSCTFDLEYYLPTSEMTGTRAHLSYGPEAHVVPADSSRFLVVTDDVECDSSAMGCTEYGLPTFSQDRSQIAESESVWLLNLPDEYGDILCSHSELFCEEWENADHGTYYFKHPGDQTCEYRTDVTINGTTYDGWFRTDTDSFCYGAGGCSESGASCTTDADCGSSGGSCVIDVGSYVIGGDQSGLWYNGDSDYEGWVGSCDENYNGCTEFEDVLDLPANDFYGTADGESYFYIDNESLEESSLPSSQQCDGQVSQKEGCGLFHDITDSSYDYSATATYVASTHSDVFFGDKPYALVDPIDCDSDDSAITPVDSSTSVDLCSTRCAYDNAQLYDLTEDYTDAYTYGTSCYEDADCAAFESEAGETIEGTCTTGATRLENDTNRVLKVDRDRECSEWLSCSDAQTVWDERTNSYRTICSDVTLCDEYSSSGNASFCSSWKDDSTATVIDIERYTDRDVSWYGDEYSGYAIPDIYPVELLTQAIVSPPSGYCDNSDAYHSDDNSPFDYTDSTSRHGDECSDDDECNEGYDVEGENCVTSEEAEEEYNLVYNAGECDGDYGESCTVGYCENTGEACADSDACGDDGGRCVDGQYVYPLAEPSVCSTDTECRASGRYPTSVCESSQCVLYGDYHAVGSTLSTEYLRYSVQTQVGSCIRGSCLVAPSGDPVDTDEGESQLCRGYPESNSPFPNEIVERWKYIDEDGNAADGGTAISEDVDVVIESGIVPEPYETVSGFDNVKLCQPGEDCVCNYKRYTYGDDGTRSLANDSTYADDAVGLCVGGVYDGAFCSSTNTTASGTAAGIKQTTCEDPDSDVATDDGGECVYPTNIDTLLGLEGYCLERDTGINIHGNRDDEHRACLTWLPVDQLAGATDLYAKYANAGFAQDAYFCSDVNMYYNASSIPGCAEIRGEDGLSLGPAAAGADNQDWCRLTMACPDGYFAVGGPAEDEASTTSAYEYQNTCMTGVNACPYLCVPMNSVHTDGEDAGVACADPNAVTIDVNLAYSSPFSNAYANNDVYFTSSKEETTTLLDHYQDCTNFGVSAVYDELGIWGSPHEEQGASDASGDVAYHLNDDDEDDTIDRDGSFRYQFAYTDFYPACTTLVEMSEGIDDYGYAWTDRVASSASTHTIAVGDLTYDFSTVTSPYGISLSPSDVAAGDDSYTDPVPAVVPSCGEVTMYDTASPAENVDDPTSCGGDDPGFATDSSPQAWNYIAWGSTSMNTDGGNVSTSEDRSDIGDRLQQLFAKPLSYFSWSREEDQLATGGPSLGEYSEQTSLASGLDYDVRGTEGNPPTVWSLDLGSCVDTECEEGEENELTLNNANEGNQSADEFFRAYLKFYAAADKNQLPIRRIIVDWGDTDSAGEPVRTGSNTADNFYKNHRGLVEGGTTSKCDTDDEWGMTSESCDPNYLNYSHIYTCSDADLLQLDACETDEDGYVTNSPCTDGNSCYYRPKVNIRDNWGWCTGVCEGGTDDGGDPGCFEGDEDYVTLFTATDPLSECAYDTYPNGAGFADPWVYYSGTVVVTP